MKRTKSSIQEVSEIYSGPPNLVESMWSSFSRSLHQGDATQREWARLWHYINNLKSSIPARAWQPANDGKYVKKKGGKGQRRFCFHLTFSWDQHIGTHSKMGVMTAHYGPLAKLSTACCMASVPSKSDLFYSHAAKWVLERVGFGTLLYHSHAKQSLY